MPSLRNKPCKSVKLPDPLLEAIIYWHQSSAFESDPQNAAIDALLHEGLAKPKAVKRALSREHLVSLNFADVPYSTLCLPQNTWDAIDLHIKTYQLPSISEAVRELLRLGLGLPQPKAVPVMRGYQRKSPLSRQTRETIRAMAATGKSHGEIVQALQVSKAYVSKVLLTGPDGYLYWPDNAQMAA